MVVLRSKRSFIVPLFLFLNTLVFAMWTLNLEGNANFMLDNFTVSWSLLERGRWWVLVTSVFSHQMFPHFLINMFVLNSFGGVMEKVMGWKAFLRFYLIAGIFSSFCHGFVSAWVLGSPDLPAVGASGAIAGVLLLFSLMFPKERILLLGIIPIPALWGALAFIGLDIWGVIAQAGGGGLPIGHGAHLGGAFTGIVYYFLFVRSRTRRFNEII